MKIAVLFPGQGSHYIGMGRDLCERSASARDVFSEAGDILGLDLAKLCFDGSFSELNQPRHMFPAILTLGTAMHGVFLEEGGNQYERLYAGHSLGEYTALVAAGTFSFSDALRLVRYRGILGNSVLKNAPGSMVVIDGITIDVLNNLADVIKTNELSFSVSCYNTSDQFVAAVADEIFLELQRAVIDKGGMMTPLPTGIPFHTSHMRSFQTVYKEELDKYRIACPESTVLSNVTARPYRNQTDVYRNLLEQLVSPVRWVDIMKSFERHGVSYCIEMSTKNILCGLLSRAGISCPVLIYGQDGSRRLWREQCFQGQEENKLL